MYLAKITIFSIPKAIHQSSRPRFSGVCFICHPPIFHKRHNATKESARSSYDASKTISDVEMAGKEKGRKHRVKELKNEEAEKLATETIKDSVVGKSGDDASAKDKDYPLQGCADEDVRRKLAKEPGGKTMDEDDRLHVDKRPLDEKKTWNN